MEQKPTALPPAFLAGATVLIMMLVLFTVWRNTLHRPNIQGTWSSGACEEATGGNDRKLGLKRTYVLTGGEWKTRVDYFVEPTCVHPTFSFELKGPYELGDKSEEIEGATHGEFNITSIELTPHLPEVAQVFTQSGCGNTKWEVDVAKPVGETGCLGFTPKISDCPILFNTVKRDGDSIYFADHVPGQGLCKRDEWPKALNPSALTRNP